MEEDLEREENIGEICWILCIEVVNVTELDLWNESELSEVQRLEKREGDEVVVLTKGSEMG